MALALTKGRTAAAAIGSVLAAISVAAAVAGHSCRVSTPGPEAAVRDMLQAAKAGDRDVVYDLLSPATHARLEAEAKHATDLVGASQRYTAKDLISIGSSDGVSPPTDITVVEEHANHAVVEVVSAAGRSRMELVKVDGHWLVDLPGYGSM